MDRKDVSPRLKRLLPILLLLVASISLFASGAPRKAAMLLGFASSDSYVAASERPFAAPFFATVSSATINTDKDDYRPGETVVISGSGWTPGEQVRLQVVHIEPQLESLTPHQGHEPWEVAADGSGNVAAAWIVDEDSLNQTLLLTAEGLTSGSTASKVFTDSSVGTYDQCANDDGDGYDGDPGVCDWTNGNLQRNNSTYSEGEATVQRLWLSNLAAGSVHTITLKYGTTKQGKHAYDYLTRWNLSEDWITDADLCADIDANGSQQPGGSCTLWGTDDTLPIPVDPNPAFSNGGPGGIPVPQPNDGTRYFTMRNGDMTAATTPAVVSGTYAGDSETVITITFTVGNDPDACPTNTNCSVALWFGAHIAHSDQWASGGATTVPGSPYHVALDAIDGTSIGQRDNQMQAGAIVLPAAQLTIVKEAFPEDPQNFEFQPSANLNGGTNFFLDDDGLGGDEACTGGNCLDQRVFASLPAGTYSVEEINIATGWTLTGAVCSDGSPVNNIVLDSGENVICTFTNRKPDAQIDLSPLTATNRVGEAHTITATVQQDDQYPAGAPGDGATGFGPAPDGTTVNFSLLNNTAGASFSGSSSCVTAGGSCSVQINTTTAGSVDIRATTTFNVIGVSLTRTTNSGGLNSADANKIYVDAQIDISPLEDTNPVNEPHTFTATVQQDDGLAAGAGGDGVTGWAPAPDGTLVTFSFVQNTIGAVFVNGVNTCTTAGGTGTCSVQINSSAPGVVIVSATTTFNVGGLSMTRTTGTGGNNSANAQKTYVAGVIIVDKVTVPAADPTLFSFTTNYGSGSFQLADQTAPNNSGNLPPGTYSVAETVPGGWNLTSATCSDGSPVNAISLQAGETVTCTFTNTKLGSITIVKDAVPNDAQDFAFTSTGGLSPSSFSLDDDGDATLSNTQTYNDLLPGSFTVTEAATSGWSLTGLVCTGGGGNTSTNTGTKTASIGLDAGENITCTFTNTKDATVTIIKVAVPNDAQDFAFTTTGDGPAPWASFSLDDDADPTLANSRTFTFPAAQHGAKTVTEGLVTGWDLTNLVCSEGSVSIANRTASFTVDPGDAITCTFTNTKRGRIIVDKVTDPAGDPQSFAFTTTGTGYVGFNLTDAAPPNSQEVLPGSYTVSETVLAGWDLTNAACDMGETPDSIDVGPGETVTCTFTNTKRGEVRVDKVTVPGSDPQSFNFTSSFGPFALTDQSALFSSGAVVPGTYSVAETVPTGWDLTSATCSDGSPINAISVQAGEIVTCVFTNTKRGTITIVKDAVPNDAQDFSFTATESTDTTIPDFSLDDDPGDGTLPNTRIFTDLKPGSYSVTEDGETGWSLTDLQCTAGGTPSGSTANIVLAAGASVTCTFTNTKDATVTIIKDAVPNDAQDFAFTTTGDGPAPWSSFALDDDSDGTLLNSRTFTFTAAQLGAKTVTEGAVTGWDLTSLVCNEGSTDLGTRTASITVDAGDAITCTFTNTKRGTIRVVKATNPAGAGGFVFTGDVAGTIGDGATLVVSNLVPGTYTSTEAVMNGWVLTNIVCGTGGSGDIATRTATFNLPAGGDITCTFTNQRLPQLRLIKDIVPDSDTGLFDLRDNTVVKVDEGGDGADSNFFFTTVGAHTVDELAGSTSPTTLDDYVSKVVCDSGKGSTDPGTSHSFSLAYADIVTCTFTNTRKASVQVIKTFQGGPITGPETFTFTLRTGASATETGTVVETQTANSTNGGTLNFTTKLTPGNSYQICEVVMVGWSSSISSLPGAFVIQTEPDGDNSTYCVAFTPTAGENVVITVDNTPPPGGDARTIGYWKNWSSCTRGRQAPVLDYILWSFAGGTRVEVELPLPDFPIGTYTGTNLGNFQVTTCDAAFNILSKRLANGTAKNGRSMASNAAVNMAAQLLAAKLNIQASADPQCIQPVIDLADDYLADVGYNGTSAPSFPKPKGDAMNFLAGLLDDYNNNTLSCPLPPLPPGP